MAVSVRTIHTWLGWIGGIALAIIGMAGAILIFADEIDDAFYPVVAASAHHPRSLTFNDILAAAHTAYPAAQISGLRLRQEGPDTAFIVTMNNAGSLWFAQMDPVSGSVLAARNADHSLVRQLLALHRSFFFRPWGEALVGVFAIMLFGSAVTGAYVYRHSLLKLTRHRIRWGRGTRVVASNIHTLVGTLAILFQVTMSITGFVIISPVYGKLFRAEAPRGARMPLPRLPLDSLAATAADTLPGFRLRTISLPATSDAPIRMLGSIDSGNVLLGPTGSVVAFDAVSGKCIRRVDIRKAGFGEQFDQVVRGIHFGGYGGLPLKIVYALGGLTPATLTITSLLLLRLRRRREAAIARHIVAAPAAAEGA